MISWLWIFRCWLLHLLHFCAKKWVIWLALWHLSVCIFSFSILIIDSWTKLNKIHTERDHNANQITHFWHSLAKAFSALTLLSGCQEEHPACENWVMRCWCRWYLCGARCRLFAYDPADASGNPISAVSFWTYVKLASRIISSLALYESRLVSPFWYWLTRVVLEKRSLNGCSSSSSSYPEIYRCIIEKNIQRILHWMWE